MLTQPETDAIKVRVEAATPGPWKCEAVTNPSAWFIDGPRIELRHGNNAAFIAAARQDIPALLADREEVVALAKELAVAVLHECGGDVGASRRNKALLAKARAAGLLEGE